MDSELSPLLQQSGKSRGFFRIDSLHSAAKWRWGVASVLCACLVVSSVFLAFASYRNVEPQLPPDSQLMAENLKMILQSGISLFVPGGAVPCQENILKFLNMTDQPNMFPWLSLGTIGQAVNYGHQRHKWRMELEKTLRERGITQDPDSAMGIHSRYLRLEKRARRLMRHAIIKEEASRFLKNKFNLSPRQVLAVLPLLDQTGSYLFANGDMPRSRAACWKDNPFRTIDGQCNNIHNPRWGSSLWPYKRLLRPDYGDGVSTPRETANKKELPNARDITLSFYHTGKGKESPTAGGLSIFFGLFIDHDLTDVAGQPPPRSSGKPISCCNPELNDNPELKHPECYEIPLSPDDPFYSKYNVTCLEFTRAAPGSFGSFGPRQQMNHVTSFLDASTVYGSSGSLEHALRSHQGGLLKNSTVHSEEMLLQDQNTTCGNPGILCFTAGDFRNNLQFPLSTVHAVWLREHNRIARELSELNPQFDDQRLYQEARRLVIALLQHVTYNEYLPLVLGEDLLDKSNIRLQKTGYFNGYKSTVDPTLANVIGAAAFRFGHSQVMNHYDLTGENRSVLVRNAFLNPEPIYTGGVCPIFKGLLMDKAMDVGTHISKELRDYTFKGTKRMFGTDLASVTIQRGRDHGLAGYAAWRKRSGLSRINKWEDLASFADAEDVAKLDKLYTDIQDVDLMVGAVLEPKAPDALIGPTLSYLIANQFKRLRLGDRYWYESGTQPYPFTPEQLQEIRKVSLARILCNNNADLPEVLPQALRVTGKENVPTSCDDTKAIPSLDLNLWKNLKQNIYRSGSQDDDHDSDDEEEDNDEEEE